MVILTNLKVNKLIKSNYINENSVYPPQLGRARA